MWANKNQPTHVYNLASLDKGRIHPASGCTVTEKRQMTNQSHPSAQLVLCEDPGLGQIRVDVEAYIEFRLQITRGLDTLVARWAHVAAPSAGRTQAHGFLGRP